VNGPTRLLRTAENPGCSAETGKIRVARDCVVVDAASIEPVSTVKFPANREKNREFRGNRPFAGDLGVQSTSEFNCLQRNSLRNGTGNF
jgi:hypothetical protein